MSQQSGLAAGAPPATDAALLRLVVVSTDHDDILAARLLAHLLDAERHPLSGSPESVELQRWTRVARGCREYLEPLEASDWWSATRAADHAWAHPAYSADPLAIRARLTSVDRVVEALAHMPAVHRIALALHDVEGLSAPAVAQAMRSSEETALERIRRGRIRIVHALNPAPALAAGADFEGANDDECAQTRLAFAAASSDQLRDASNSSRHAAMCARCSGLASALAEVVDHFGNWPTAPSGARS